MWHAGPAALPGLTRLSAGCQGPIRRAGPAPGGLSCQPPSTRPQGAQNETHSPAVQPGRTGVPSRCPSLPPSPSALDRPPETTSSACLLS